MNKSIASRFLESLTSKDDIHDDKESRDMWNSLENCECYAFVKAQIEEMSSSEFSHKTSTRHESSIGFLRGPVYGYVYGKTGDRGFALKVSEFAVKKTTSGKTGYEVG